MNKCLLSQGLFYLLYKSVHSINPLGKTFVKEHHSNDDSLAITSVTFYFYQQGRKKECGNRKRSCVNDLQGSLKEQVLKPTIQIKKCLH